MKKDAKDNSRAVARSKRNDHIYYGLIIIGVFTLLALILCGVFGKSGNAVRDFLTGVFGFAVYGYCFGAIAIGIFVLLGKRASVSGKLILIYAAIMACVIAMCHIATSDAYASAGYGQYIKLCFTQADSAGGVLGAVLLYPFCKVFVFSQILFALLLVGFLALAALSQLNVELSFHRFGRRKHVAKTEGRVNERKLFNGTPTGKELSNSIPRTLTPHTPDYLPLENCEDIAAPTAEETRILPDEEEPPARNATSYEDELDDEIDRNKYDGKSRAMRFLYGGDGAEVIPSVETDVDASTDRRDVPQDDADASDKGDLYQERYEEYTNNYRRRRVRQVLDDMRSERERKRTEGEASSEDNNTDNAPRVDSEESNGNGLDIRDAFEAMLNANFGSVDGAVGEAPASPDTDEEVRDDSGSDDINGQDYEVEDRTQTNDEPNESMLDYLARQKKDGPINPYVPHRDVTSEAPPPPAKPLAPKKPPVPYRPKPYVPPSIDCLKDYDESAMEDPRLNEKIVSMQELLKSFDIGTKVENVVVGPTFTRIEISVVNESGGKPKSIDEIPRRYNDISACLEVESLRIEAPIPGKRVCGLEIPNAQRGKVSLKSIIDSPQFNNANGGLSFALGRDIDGRNYVVDAVSFPHALVAGATGTGKSVCLNAMLTSLLFKYSPQEMRLILIDPKMVEFNIYMGLPHLLIPEILSEEEKVINALYWAVDEMNARYKIIMARRFSNIQDYNADLKAGEEKLPYILIVIDEVADLILSPIKNELESLVKRLTGKARASGIHLILATQRPSADVVTGTIKANMNTRIALTVSQFEDSRVILGGTGAEKLLSLGDMLYRSSSMLNPVRLQGAFLHTKEVVAVVDYVKAHNESHYDEDIIARICTVKKREEDKSGEGVFEQQDREGLFPDSKCVDALEIGIETGTVTISLMQRKLSIGHGRAGKIYDWLISMGYVKEEGTKREFVLTRDEVEALIENDKRRRNGDE